MNQIGCHHHHGIFTFIKIPRDLQKIQTSNTKHTQTNHFVQTTLHSAICTKSHPLRRQSSPPSLKNNRHGKHSSLKINTQTKTINQVKHRSTSLFTFEPCPEHISHTQTCAHSQTLHCCTLATIKQTLKTHSTARDTPKHLSQHK